VNETVEFVIRNGYTVLFLWVLGEQLGLPIPALPMLLAAGALSGMGHLSIGWTVGLALAASMLADLAWYEVGRRRGGSLLKLLCRVALEPESCVRRTEDVFQRHGARSLLVAKFVPGLSTAAPPMAGMTGMSRPRFALFNLLGALVWAGGFSLLGYLFSGQIERIADYAARLGNGLLVVAGLSLVAYVGGKYDARRRFHKQLVADRITPEELKQKMDAGEPLAIIDLRHPLDFLPYPQVIPGTIRLLPAELQRRQQEIPRDREIVLYCT
jgi:membrane protein DedA with SNARE-associated domain